MPCQDIQKNGGQVKMDTEKNTPDASTSATVAAQGKEINSSPQSPANIVAATDKPTEEKKTLKEKDQLEAFSSSSKATGIRSVVHNVLLGRDGLFILLLMAIFLGGASALLGRFILTSHDDVPGYIYFLVGTLAEAGSLLVTFLYAARHPSATLNYKRFAVALPTSIILLLPLTAIARRWISGEVNYLFTAACYFVGKIVTSLVVSVALQIRPSMSM